MNFIDMKEIFAPSHKTQEQKWPSQGQTTNSVLHIRFWIESKIFAPTLSNLGALWGN